MNKIAILFLFTVSILVAEASFAQRQRNFCFTKSRGITFRVNRGEVRGDIKAEAFSRCLRDRQTRDEECDRNLRCDDEGSAGTPVAPNPQPPPPTRDRNPAPVINPAPAPMPQIPQVPKMQDQILVCEINGLRSSGPNQEAITTYLLDLCKRRNELISCLANLYCNDQPVYRFLKRCELRGNNFQVLAYGVDERMARQQTANACRGLPGDDSYACQTEASCVDVSNRYGMDISSRAEGRRIYQGTPPVQPTPIQPAPVQPAPVRPTGPVVAPPRPSGGGDVIVTPPTPVYRGKEPQPEIPPEQGPFR